MTTKMYVLSLRSEPIGVYTNWRYAYTALMKIMMAQNLVPIKCVREYVDDRYTLYTQETGELVEVAIDEVEVDNKYTMPENPYEEMER